MKGTTLKFETGLATQINWNTWKIPNIAILNPTTRNAFDHEPWVVNNCYELSWIDL